MVIKLEDARLLKPMKMALNIPIEQRTFSAEYSRHWVRLMDAQSAFIQAVDKYTTGRRAGLLSTWKLMRRKLDAFAQQFSHCATFCETIGGHVLRRCSKASRTNTNTSFSAISLPSMRRRTLNSGRKPWIP
ncbi:hypothetical protein IVB18_33610 [Bradyrhizobium sp. 186]|uniref:hypothetical protein n=1 Tax=Bradyrhizobium sp. 186 TaxID=2782654 RepID=UPI002001252B|nr:hypothetical protein [Bradyrhizobium sp. 186]UPK33131.1 hypothetical protein IVB18_33610 [Bradyrhizobium sp. 186]